MVNSSAKEVRFRIQEGRFYEWSLVADTGLPSPQDFVETAQRQKLTSSDYIVSGRSVVVLCKAAVGMEREGFPIDL
jgi:hypothetical protein